MLAPSPIRMKANMRRTALPELPRTVADKISSAFSRLADEISQLTDSLLLDVVLEAAGMGNAVGPRNGSCDHDLRDVRCLTTLSAGATLASGGCWQGQSLFRKSLLSSLRHGVAAFSRGVGSGVGTGAQDADTSPPCCGPVSAAPVPTVGSAGVLGPWCGRG